MPAKVKGIKEFEKKLKDFLPDARSKFAKIMKAEIVDAIVEQIVSGNSPVKGQNRYPSYSDAYAKKKGRSQPADLLLTGQMLDSMVAVQKANNIIEIKFKGKEANDKAENHQFGITVPQRKILPVEGGEQFKQKVQDKIVEAAQRAIKETKLVD